MLALLSLTILGLSLKSWLLWAVVLIGQNFAFTFVSRARNSGSLKRHMYASVFSNGIWFVSQIFAVSTFMAILTGRFGVWAAVFAGVFYTAFTILGSILAHYYSLRTEKGHARVGARKDVATFTKEEGEQIRKLLSITIFAEPSTNPEPVVGAVTGNQPAAPVGIPVVKSGSLLA